MSEVKWLRSVALSVASVGGAGMVEGGGTVAAAIVAIAWWLVQPSALSQVLITIVLTVVGVWSAGYMGSHGWEKDDKKIVIDEAAGMAVSIVLLPASPAYVVAGFVLFRFFDIVKPLGIRKMERWRGGWGVMADDILSGIYSWLVLKTIIALNIF